MTRDGKSKKNTNVNVLPKKNYWFGFWLMTRYGLSLLNPISKQDDNEYLACRISDLLNLGNSSTTFT